MIQQNLFPEEMAEKEYYHLDFPVSPGLLQENLASTNQAKKILDTSFRTLLTFFHKRDLSVVFLRMFQASLPKELMMLKMIWKLKATPRQSFIVQVAQLSESRTKENASLSLPLIYPTPRASDAEGGIVKNVEQLKPNQFCADPFWIDVFLVQEKYCIP